jgi:hypothetical protein
MLECKEEIPVLTDGTYYEFIEKDLEAMASKELIKINTETALYEITDSGKSATSKLLGVYDQILKFEVFSSVSVAMVLNEDELDEENNLLPQLYDPRFQKPASLVEQKELGTEDLRIAMMDFLATEMSSDDEPLKLDPHRIVFTQMLSTGKLKDENIWFDLNLGTISNKIEEIIASAYQWKDTAEDEDGARDAMISIYTAGMLEQRKRDGQECSDCKSPLAIFEMWAKEDGKTLDDCPNPECNCTFKPPPPDYECPVCNTGVNTGQRMCSCGVVLDFSLPPGTVQTETTTEVIEEEEDIYDPVWSYGYDYTPYGYYDPYDPFVDVMAFGLVCAVLW